MEEDYSELPFGRAHQLANERGMQVFVWRGKRFNSMYATDTPETFRQRMQKNSTSYRQQQTGSPHPAIIEQANFLPGDMRINMGLNNLAPRIVERPIPSLEETMNPTPSAAPRPRYDASAAPPPLIGVELPQQYPNHPPGNYLLPPEMPYSGEPETTPERMRREDAMPQQASQPSPRIPRKKSKTPIGPGGLVPYNGRR